MDIVLVAIVSNPLIMFFSFRQAKKIKYDTHRTIQKFLLFASLTGVFFFELDIRLTGGERAFLKGSPFADTKAFKSLLIFHIVLASLSYGAWIWLFMVSQKIFKKELPGSFSSQHRKVGQLIFTGMIVTALTGVTLYILAFANL